ncbi:MAG TPA: hypothetical protein GX499_06815 [Clostridiales bacterium]|nr:hypothetical protein [Clostridiales bacterium]
MEQQVFQTIYQQQVRPKEMELRPAVEHILSEDVFTLEHRLAQWVGTNHCVAVSDAASGIALALIAAGVSPGDTVLCAALGCALPVQGMMLVGASPVFVDVNPNTYTIDPYCLEYALYKLRRMGRPVPSALIATDLFGAPCNYAALEDICRSEGIVLIEDLSGAFGAEIDGRPAGSFGRFAVASFATPCPLEELGGGAVFCQRDDDARRLRALRQARQPQVSGEPTVPRMGSVDAFLINARLEHCAYQAEQRRNIAHIYRTMLADKLRMQQLVRGAKSVYSQLVVALPRSRERGKVAARLRERNIPAGAPFCGMQTDRDPWNQVMLVNALSLAGRLLSLPIHPYLSPHLTEHIARCLLQAMDECS